MLKFLVVEVTSNNTVERMEERKEKESNEEEVQSHDMQKEKE